MMQLYDFYMNLEPWTLVLIIILATWELVWKGLGLWRSAKNGHKIWFILFLIPLNTAGILPIIYLLIFRPKGVPKEKNNERVTHISVNRKTVKKKK